MTNATAVPTNLCPDWCGAHKTQINGPEDYPVGARTEIHVSAPLAGGVTIFQYVMQEDVHEAGPVLVDAIGDPR